MRDEFRRIRRSLRGNFAERNGPVPGLSYQSASAVTASPGLTCNQRPRRPRAVTLAWTDVSVKPARANKRARAALTAIPIDRGTRWGPQGKRQREGGRREWHAAGRRLATTLAEVARSHSFLATLVR